MEGWLNEYVNNEEDKEIIRENLMDHYSKENYGKIFNDM